MAIDYNSGITSLDTGASDITYTGNQGPKSPDQMLMASADPMLVDEYKKYVFEMEEQGLPPISFREFVQQIMAGKAEGGRAGYQSGELVKPPGISDEEWNRIMFGSRGPRPLSSQSPFLSVHADGGRTGFQGGGADYMPTDPRPRGNPGITEEIENLKEFRIANPDMEDVADYKGYYERLKRLEELKRLMHGVQSEPLSGKWDSGPQPGSLEYWQMMTQRPQGRAYGGSANPTYTQSRKQRINAAGGGIMGSNAGSMLVAPTADGSRPGYGWNPFKAVKKVFKKVKEDIIPNEVKALAKSPVGKAALMYAGGAGLSSLAAGQGMGSLAQLSTYNPMNVMSNIGTGVGRGITGARNLLGIDNAIDSSLKSQLVPEGAEDLIYGMPVESRGPMGDPMWDIMTSGGGINPVGSRGPMGDPMWDLAKTGMGNVLSKGPMGDPMWDIAKQATQQVPYTDAILRGVIPEHKQPSLLDRFKSGASSVMDFLGPKDPYKVDGEMYHPPNIAGPIAGGMAAGAIQAAMPKDVMPQDTSGIDIADIRSRALTGSDPDLHFLPPAEATTAYAQGGRTGYYAGDMVEQKENIITAFSDYKNRGGIKGFRDWFSGIYLPEAVGPRGIASLDPEYADSDTGEDVLADWPYGFAEPGTMGSPEMIGIEYNANGGRIGYERGRVVRPGGYAGVIDRNIANLQTRKELYPNEWTVEDEAELQRQLGVKGGVRDKLLSGDPVPEETVPEEEGSFWDFLPFVGKAQGGRIGYADAGKVWGMDKARKAWDKLGSNSKLGYVDFVDFFLNGPWGSNQYRTGSDKLAEGGRIGAQEGGLMDLGGMEKDYRQEGGFVPIGGEERADDVPARLSKNEFVFTADAVRSAGGGDIDAGAEVMENVMNNLEQGGKISEESQGLEGARNMFATAQRLEGVL